MLRGTTFHRAFDEALTDGHLRMLEDRAPRGGPGTRSPRSVCARTERLLRRRHRPPSARARLPRRRRRQKQTRPLLATRRALREPVPGERGHHQRERVQQPERHQVTQHRDGAGSRARAAPSGPRASASVCPRATGSGQAAAPRRTRSARKRARNVVTATSATAPQASIAQVDASARVISTNAPASSAVPTVRRGHRQRVAPAAHGSTRTETRPSQPASSATSIPAASGSATVAAPASTTLPGGRDRPRPRAARRAARRRAPGRRRWPLRWRAAGASRRWTSPARRPRGHVPPPPASARGAPRARTRRCRPPRRAG